MFLVTGALLSGCNNSKDMSRSTPVINDKMYIDVHHMGKRKGYSRRCGKSTSGGSHGRKQIWCSLYEVLVRRAETGTIYCLSQSPGKKQIIRTHKEAHGLIPQEIHEVKTGEEASVTGNLKMYLDIHNLGQGKVTAKAVAQMPIKKI